MNVILFGFKGCGKTYFGKLLAKELDCQFVDTDDIIIQLHAKESGQHLTPRAIYQSIGDVGFRLLEKKAISTLITIKNAVIALGGGAVLSPQNIEILQKIGKLIYLEASLETIKGRGITLLEGPIEKLYFERMPVYHSISAPHINVDILNEKTVLSILCSTFSSIIR
jgi:shikimate kinase